MPISGNDGSGAPNDSARSDEAGSAAFLKIAAEEMEIADTIRREAVKIGGYIRSGKKDGNQDLPELMEVLLCLNDKTMEAIGEAIRKEAALMSEFEAAVNASRPKAEKEKSPASPAGESMESHEDSGTEKKQEE